MKNSLQKLLVFIVTIFSLYDHPFAQAKVFIAAKPFVITANDSTYKDLNYKLPDFICNGILYKSGLQLRPVYLPDGSLMQYRDITTKTSATDLNYIKNYKHIFDSLGIKYFIDGEFIIDNERFYITVNATDFTNNIIQYQSSQGQLSEFQRIIDETCSNLNYRLLNKGSESISFRDFEVSFSKSSNGNNSNDIYAPDFLPKFLSYNLINSEKYTILPYNSAKDRTTGNFKDSIHIYTDSIIISGKIIFETLGSCIIYPIFYSYNDSLNLPAIKNLLQNKDNLLSTTLNTVQSVLAAVVEAGGITLFKKLLNSYKEPDYKNAFTKALKERNMSLAYFFADQMPGKFENGVSRSELLKAIVRYKENNNAEALEHLTEYLTGDSASIEANYYAGLAYIKAGRYEVAKSFLKKVDSTNEMFEDVFFQKGLCLYYQDSISKALVEFARQASFNDKIHPELYTYIAFCYKELKDLQRAEYYFLKIYSIGPTNIIYRKDLSNFYNDLAQAKFDSSLYNDSYLYYSKAYNLIKSYSSLFGQIVSIIDLNKPDSIVQRLIQTGIQDTIFNESAIYLDLAEFCRNKINAKHEYLPSCLHKAIGFLNRYIKVTGEDATIYEVIGSTYFRLLMLDSAEYYYKKDIKNLGTDPLVQNKNVLTYFDLAELQIISSKVDSAIATLNDIKKRFVDNNYFNSSNDYMALYYFYLVEGKLLRHQDYQAEEKGLQESIKTLSKNYKKKFIFNWSFGTFYNWLKKDKYIDANIRKKLIENLCLVIRYSVDKLPCTF